MQVSLTVNPETNAHYIFLLSLCLLYMHVSLCLASLCIHHFKSVRGARFLNAIRSSGTVHAPRFAVISVTSKAREKEKQQEGDSTKREAKDYSSKKKIPHRLSPRRGERSSAVLQRVRRSSGSEQ